MEVVPVEGDTVILAGVGGTAGRAKVTWLVTTYHCIPPGATNPRKVIVMDVFNKLSRVQTSKITLRIPPTRKWKSEK
jgi:hypothetical protein